MSSRTPGWLGAAIGCLAATVLPGCDLDARGEYQRQLEVCSVAEGNGLLDPAVDACGAALRIAGQNTYPAAELAALQQRLGRLQRQRGNFEAAEALLRPSVEHAEAAGDSAALATRRVELAVILAGQDRWLEGWALLEGTAPFVADLSGDDRIAAANAYRGFAIRLGMLGHAREAESCRALAEVLAESPP